MQNKILIKMAVVFFLVLVMLVPLGWVSDLISERSQFREVAKTSISQSWTGAQSVAGPVWVIPYKTRSTSQVWDEKLKQHIDKTQTSNHRMIVLPSDVEIEADSDSDVRYRGLHTVPVYTTRLNIQGRFSNQRLVDLAKRKPNIEWGNAFLAMAIHDPRGVTTRPILDWQGQPLEFRSGSGLKEIANGMHAELSDIDLQQVRSYPFAFSFELRGMESLSFAPVGKNNRIRLKSDWLHPSFTGRLLPQTRTIDETGFEALWQVSSFSTNIRHYAEQCEKGACSGILQNIFGVTLVQPVDIYQLAKRSVKYGVLFVGLTFLSFLMFEALKQQAIHPVQYIFVGSALSIFFLLLVSLSEHLSFGLSYALATIACSSLLTVYLTAVFRQLRYGLIFGCTITLIYGMLFVIIKAEDMALLMGSGLIFVVLSVLMLATRNIDWYQYEIKRREQLV